LLAGGWATDINYVGKLHAVATSPSVTGAVAAAAAAQPAPATSPTPPVAGPGQPISLLPASFTVPAR
jgi:hypothetical protein